MTTTICQPSGGLDPGSDDDENDLHRKNVPDIAVEKENLKTTTVVGQYHASNISTSTTSMTSTETLQQE